MNWSFSRHGIYFDILVRVRPMNHLLWATPESLKPKLHNLIEFIILEYQSIQHGKSWHFWVTHLHKSISLYIYGLNCLSVVCPSEGSQPMVGVCWFPMKQINFRETERDGVERNRNRVRRERKMNLVFQTGAMNDELLDHIIVRQDFKLPVETSNHYR